MVDCVCSIDTDVRTECMALKHKHYVDMVRQKKCGTDRCPFYKKKKGAKK